MEAEDVDQLGDEPPGAGRVGPSIFAEDEGSLKDGEVES
jgi:hypothetical protein